MMNRILLVLSACLLCGATAPADAPADAPAAGLAAAIPAVMAYNHFTDKIRVLNSELEMFSSDLLNIIERDVQNQMEA